jgi:hypothetical protein
MATASASVTRSSATGDQGDSDGVSLSMAQRSTQAMVVERCLAKAAARAHGQAGGAAMHVFEAEQRALTQLPAAATRRQGPTIAKAAAGRSAATAAKRRPVTSRRSATPSSTTVTGRLLIPGCPPRGKEAAADTHPAPGAKGSATAPAAGIRRSAADDAADSERLSLGIAQRSTQAMAVECCLA